jgi:hypothetical protein
MDEAPGRKSFLAGARFDALTPIGGWTIMGIKSGRLVQWYERFVDTEEVIGSIPIPPIQYVFPATPQTKTDDWRVAFCWCGTRLRSKG